MMAYESHLQHGGTSPPAAAVPAVPHTAQKEPEVTELPNGKLVLKKDNLYMIPFAFADVVLLIVMIVMNYLFRFNVSVRDSSSLANYALLTIFPSDVLPARPFFNYSTSIEDNQKGENTFGITFTMQEYAFFVPLFVFPLLLVPLVELIYLFYPKGHLKTVVSFGLEFNTFVRRSLRIYFVYLFYASLTGMVTSFIKLLVAKPRPHFLAVCSPPSSATPLSLSDSSVYMFNVLDLCHDGNDNWSEINEALRSFPSYHATIAFYAGTFLVLYLMYMIHLKGTYSFGGLASLPVMVMATIGGLHRWCTYHADGWDIAWGAFIGVVGALWAVHVTLNAFQERVWAQDLVPTIRMNQNTLPPKAATPSVVAGPAYPNPAYSVDGEKGMRSQPDPYVDNRRPSHIQRIPVQGVPPPSRAPAQAFNSGFGSEPESPRGTPSNYNMPRQRYSVPAIQMRPQPSRPPSAHPSLGHRVESRPLSRHESASYF